MIKERNIVLILGIFLSLPLSAAVHINQLGYESEGPKTALIESSSAISSTSFTIETAAGSVVHTGTSGPSQTVEGWIGRFFSVCDFSSFTTPGKYIFKSGTEVSEQFEIGSNFLFKKTVSDQVGFFNGMRCKLEDRSIPKFSSGGSFDVHGGWNDATGDLGKYLSHLSFANYMNPQQIPMVIYSLLRSWELDSTNLKTMNTGILQEAAYGADYLMRILDAEGYFYQIIFDRWGWDEAREICSWDYDKTVTPEYLQSGHKVADLQSAFREGGGMAIAALAKAASMKVSGEFTATAYLDGAKKGYTHLKANNTKYCDNREENIIDDYCALMATVELYKATTDEIYLSDARIRAASLIGRFDSRGFFFSDNRKRRPFYHAAEEGLPVLALINFLSIDETYLQEIKSLLNKWREKQLSLNDPAANPFRYARMTWSPFDPSKSGAINPASNLAAGKTLTASSTENGHPVNDAVDGSMTTRWGSVLYNGADLTCQEWLAVDLGGTYNINEVTVVWEAAHGTQYTIDISQDGNSWTSIATESAGNGGTDVFQISPAASAKHVRVHATKRSLQYAGVSIYEFQVKGAVGEQDPDIDQEPVVLNTSFFQPHTNETGYWWQGENARIASMSAALLAAEVTLNPGFRFGDNDISHLAVSQLDWILGKNPFDICMMYGYGYENYPDYPGKPDYAFPNVKGGICNGITSDSINETDVWFMPNGGTDADWRWIEQWLPHNAWYLLAVSNLSYVLERPILATLPSTPAINASLANIKLTGNNINFTSGGKTAEVSIVDIKGRVVARKAISGNGTISLKNFRSGAYCAIIKSGNSRKTLGFSVTK
ncbi:MAG: T9SS type A sorting domain-containing protein [Fibrobacter sp.]|nr:T9SS type A sorting domain-containing protein [Fibrobacter sp.]